MRFDRFPNKHFLLPVLGLAFFAVLFQRSISAENGTDPPAEAEPLSAEPVHVHEPALAHPAGVTSRPDFDFSAWEAMPIQEGGLEKSFLTFAHDFVKEVTGKPNYGGRGPVENFLSMAVEPTAWINQPILKVRHPKLRKIFTGKHGRTTPLELETKKAQWIPLLEGEDKKVLEKELGGHYRKIDKILGNENVEAPLPTAIEIIRIIPHSNFRGDPEVWRTPEEMRARTKDTTPAQDQVLASYAKAIEAFALRDATAFGKHSDELAAALPLLPTKPTLSDAKFRLFRTDTKLHLFSRAGWIYLLAAIFFVVSYLSANKALPIIGGGLLGLGVAIHIAALVIRGILAGRAPVSNLFESGVFIIGGITLFSLIISIYYRAKIVGLGGGILGAFCMGIANSIPMHYGQKISPLIDALQSYWLNIHVTSMLISYALFAVAFFVAVSYLVRRAVLTRRPGVDANQDATLQYLDSLNFRVITIGVPILTGGVILGAVWAAEAWGRPWAFDPKETASAITWMIYVLYLHMRLFQGWRGTRGIWLSIIGFAAVVFTYIGVSFFLPGLHSYVSEGESFTEFLKRILPLI